MNKEKKVTDGLDEDFDIDEVDCGSSINGKDAYQMFIDSISTFPKFTSQENLEKIKEYHSAEGDEKIALLDSIVEGNIRLVIKYAAEIASHAAPNSSEKSVRGLRMDLIQEGSQALAKAIKDFDPARGYAFSTLAVTYIKRAMYAFLNANSRMIYLPQQILDRHRLIVRASDELVKKNGTKPTFEEVASYLNNGLTAKDIEENCLIFNGVEVKSMEGDSDEDNEKNALNNLPSPDMNPQEVCEKKEQMEKLEKGRKSLTPMMNFIISHRYPNDDSEPWTLRELSEELGISKERVRQLESEAKEKLREMLS